MIVMLQSDRVTVTWATLSLFAVLIPFSVWGAIDGDWSAAIAALLVPVFMGLFLVVCMRVRLRVLRGLIARRSPLIPTLPDYTELRERGFIPDEWMPSGPSRTMALPTWLVLAAGILLPWFWGPLFGATFGDIGVGLWVAALLSGSAVLAALFALVATKYGGGRHRHS
jgi:hypothetical protein